MTFGPQWTTPPPPPGQYGLASSRPPMRARRVWGGIGLALLGHVLTIAATLVAGALDSQGAVWPWIGLGSQFMLFVICLTVGIVLLARHERGIGLGLLIGWGVGVIVLPVVGFGICVYLFSQMHS